jgi:hypothetical protein
MNSLNHISHMAQNSVWVEMPQWSICKLYNKIWLIECDPVLYSVTKHLETKLSEVGEVLC